MPGRIDRRVRTGRNDGRYAQHTALPRRPCRQPAPPARAARRPRRVRGRAASTPTSCGPSRTRPSPRSVRPCRKRPACSRPPTASSAAPPGTWTSSTSSAGSARRRATWPCEFQQPVRAPSSSRPAALHVGGKIRMDQTIFERRLQLPAVGGDARPRPSSPSRRRTWSTTAAARPRSTRPSTRTSRSSGADLSAAYADEVARLAALGCTYLQLDDTSLAYLNDPAQRAEIAERGEDAEHLHLRYIRQVNDALGGKPDGHGGDHAHVPGQLPVLLGRLGRLRLRGRGAVQRAGRGRVLPRVRRRAVRRLRAAAVRARRARWSCSAWSPPSAASWRRQDDAQAPDRRGGQVRPAGPAVPVAAVRVLLHRGGQRADPRRGSAPSSG